MSTKVRKGAGNMLKWVLKGVGKSGERSTKVLKVKRKCCEKGTNVLERGHGGGTCLGTIVFKSGAKCGKICGYND